MALTQPMTVKQLARCAGEQLGNAIYLVDEFRKKELVECLNPAARRSRVYWLTQLGVDVSNNVRREEGMPALTLDFPVVDWSLYGFVCYSQRSAVIKAMEGAMQPSAVKRRALFQDPELTMSANNARDVIRRLHEKGVVQRVEVPGKAHIHYEVTDTGRKLQTLLFNAERGGR